MTGLVVTADSDAPRTLPATETPALDAAAKPPRIASIDAARGFIMLTMIFVNDFAGISDEIAPWWMKHYSDCGPG